MYWRGFAVHNTTIFICSDHGNYIKYTCFCIRAHTNLQPLAEVSVLRDQWRVVFIIAAELYLAGAIIYSVLASGEVQPWAIEDGENSSRQTKANSARLCCETASLPRGLMGVR